MPRHKKTKIESTAASEALPKSKPKRKSKVKENTSLIKEVLENLGVSVNQLVTDNMIIKDLPSPNIQNAIAKFGFSISENDKIIDIANKIGKWYN